MTRPETAVAVKKIITEIRALDLDFLFSSDLATIVAATQLVRQRQNFEKHELPKIDTPSSQPPIP